MPMLLKYIFVVSLAVGLFDVVAQWPPSIGRLFRELATILWLAAAWVWCAAYYQIKGNAQ